MSVAQTLFFFFNDTATTEIYTLSLHDALPILEMIDCRVCDRLPGDPCSCDRARRERRPERDRKSTRLNSSHSQISYAVFCLKKKKLSPDAHQHQSESISSEVSSHCSEMAASSR